MEVENVVLNQDFFYSPDREGEVCYAADGIAEQ